MVDLKSMAIDNSKIYALVRVSSDKQDFQSQMNGILSYCRNNNIDLLEENIIQEHNVSGFNTPIEQRKGLNKIEQLANEHKIDLLIVFNQDRLARKTEIITYIEKLTKLNVLIVSVTEGIINDTSNETSDLIYMIKAWVSRFESSKTSKRVKSGKLASSKAGKYNGGKILLGYVKIGDRLAIDKSKVPIIQNMFQKYINEGSKGALEYLESVGIHKVHQSLLALIKNPQYKGYQKHDKSLYTAEEYEEIMFFNEELQIVSTEVWEKANQLRLARKTNRRGATVKTNRTDKLLESLCYCGVCGGKLTLQRDYRYEPVQYILQCRKCKELKATTQKNWSYKKIEKLVNENLEQILAYEIDKEKLEKYYNSKKNSNINELEQLLELKNKELVAKEKGISKANKNLEKMLLSDLGIDSIKIATDMISKLKKEAEELKVDISELKQQINQEREQNNSNSKKIRMLLEVKKLYARANEQQQKKLLQMLVNKIERLVNENLEQILAYEIDRDKLEQYYNSKKNSNINELEQLLELKNKELNNKNRAISKANSNLEKMLSIDLDIDSIKIVTDTINKFRAEAEELKQQILELEQQINQEMMINKESNNKIRMLLEIKKLYAKANEEQQKKLLQMLVQKIEIKNREDIKIFLNY